MRPAKPALERHPARRVVRSFGYAAEGIVTLVRTQPNVSVHLAAACVAVGLGIAVHLSPVELAVLILTSGLVLVAESVNTALESVCDLVSPGYHVLVKRAKDISAAAVLLSAIVAVVVGGLLLGPRFVALLH